MLIVVCDLVFDCVVWCFGGCWFGCACLHWVWFGVVCFGVVFAWIDAGGFYCVLCWFVGRCVLSVDLFDLRFWCGYGLLVGVVYCGLLGSG